MTSAVSYRRPCAVAASAHGSPRGRNSDVFPGDCRERVQQIVRASHSQALSRVHGKELQPCPLSNPFLYNPTEHDPRVLEIHFGFRAFFIPMTMLLVRRKAEILQLILGDPSALPDQPVSFLLVALPEIPANHLKYFKQAEKIRGV